MVDGGINMYELEEDNRREIWYLSDLHFDYVSDRILNSPEKRENWLISRMQLNRNVIYVLPGDFYDDYKKTLRFIKELEENEIVCFLTLGNHDYWSNGRYSYREINAIFEDETKDNKFARLLMTGRAYELDGVTFIGDSGFSNFKINVTDDGLEGESTEFGGDELEEFFISKKEHKQFIDAKKVRDWHIADICKLHKSWISFANQMIHTGKKLIIVTHWPMQMKKICVKQTELKEAKRDFSSDDAKLIRGIWWRQKSDMENGGNYWSIFGHTHYPEYDYHEGHSISRQIGYEPNKSFDRFPVDWFGKLIPVVPSTEIVSDTQIIKNYQTDAIYDPKKNDVELLKKLELLGFRRTGNAFNKASIAAYADNPEDFFREVRYKLRLSRTIVGYIDAASMVIKDACTVIEAAVRILEKGYQGNIIEFYTSLILAGYGYSGMLTEVQNMRKINIYDIARIYFVLYTVESFKEQLDLSNVKTIKKSSRKNAVLLLQGVELYVPRINGYEVSVSDLQPVIDELNRFIEKSTNKKTMRMRDLEAPKLKLETTMRFNDNEIVKIGDDNVKLVL